MGLFGVSSKCPGQKLGVTDRYGDGAVHKLFSAPVGRQVAAAVSVVKFYGRGPWRTRSAKCFAVGWSAGRCSDSNSCALRIGQRERPNERDSGVDDVLAAVTLQGTAGKCRG